MLVCEKPVGIISEDGGLPELLRAQGRGEVYCVHRLDKLVGGVILYARTPESAARLSKVVAERRVDKTYLAIVEGRPSNTEGELRDLLYHDARRNKSYVVHRQRRGVKEAALRYTLLDSVETGSGSLALLQIRLLTGRSHQIRVQFASRGLPLMGDRRYGSRERGNGPALWSYELGLEDPFSGEQMCFRSVPPASYPWILFPFRLKKCNELSE